LNLVLVGATKWDADSSEGSAVAMKQLTGWQIVTLIVASIAVISMSAVALLLGKDAIIALAVVMVAAIALVSWLLYG
jgi:hypothetical protein